MLWSSSNFFSPLIKNLEKKNPSFIIIFMSFLVSAFMFFSIECKNFTDFSLPLPARFNLDVKLKFFYQFWGEILVFHVFSQQKLIWPSSLLLLKIEILWYVHLCTDLSALLWNSALFNRNSAKKFVLTNLVKFRV